MISFFKKTSFDFIRIRYLCFSVSALMTLIGVASLFTRGLNLALDFTGGTLLQVGFTPPVTTGEIRKALETHGVAGMELQSITGKDSFIIRVKGSQENVNEIAEKVLNALHASFPNDTLQEQRREYVGPAVGRDLFKRAILSLVLSFIAIIIYIAFRFSNPVWGVAGVIALIHDVFFVVTLLSLTQKEVDLVIVAALLTIAGYSISDTIVIYDRMRENMLVRIKVPLYDLINMSLNETLSRTVITVLAVFLAVLSLFFVGGEAIHNFSFCMLWGLVTGTYSSVAIAAPLAYEWEKRRRPQLARPPAPLKNQPSQPQFQAKS